MKTNFIIILLSFSILVNGQTDTTKQDSTWCLNTRDVLHGGALAFAIFYSASAHGFAKNFQALIKNQKRTSWVR